MPSEGNAESWQIPVALDATEALLSLEDSGDRPAQDHRSSLPALDTASQVLQRTVQVLDGIGRAKATSERRRNAQLENRQGFLQAFPQRCRGARVHLFQLRRQAQQAFACLLGRPRSPCLPNRSTHPRVLTFGQMIEHVAQLVDLAALDQGPTAENLPNRGADALATVDHEQTDPLHRQASLHQVAQQGPAHLFALTAAFHHSQHSLRPVRLDPHRYQHHMVAEDRAVDHQHRKVLAFQRLGEPAVDLLARPGDEPPRHRGPTHRARAPLLGQLLQAPPVLARRYPHDHLLVSPLVERIFLAHRHPTRQRQFLAADTANPRPPQLDLPAAEHHATLLMPVAVGRTLLPLPDAGRTAESLAVLLQHRLEHRQPGGDYQLPQRRSGSDQHLPDPYPPTLFDLPSRCFSRSLR